MAINTFIDLLDKYLPDSPRNPSYAIEVYSKLKLYNISDDAIELVCLKIQPFVNLIDEKMDGKKATQCNILMFGFECFTTLFAFSDNTSSDRQEIIDEILQLNKPGKIDQELKERIKIEHPQSEEF